jgi:hypothetical protein
MFSDLTISQIEVEEAYRWEAQSLVAIIRNFHHEAHPNFAVCLNLAHRNTNSNFDGEAVQANMHSELPACPFRWFML